MVVRNSEGVEVGMGEVGFVQVSPEDTSPECGRHVVLCRHISTTLRDDALETSDGHIQHWV